MSTSESGQLAADERGASDWMRLARDAGARGGEEEEPELLRELLAFVLADAPYAIPVEQVREIIRVRDVTPMPRVPESVLGVVALRGEIVQVVDLRMRLRVEIGELTRRSRIIVLHGEDEKVTGILVDAVQEVLRISESGIQPTTSQEIGAVREMCTRGEEFVSIIDLEKVLEFDADE
jgi:chemotaxis signal transduction protein